MNASHFRQRAARAREMAQFGDDIRISQMLLEVAQEMDAEAETIEAGQLSEPRQSPRYNPSEAYRALLHVVGDDSKARPVQIVDLSFGGAKLRCDVAHTPGTRIVLEIPSCGLHLTGSIIRARGIEVALVFETESSSDPTLGDLLRSLNTTASTDIKSIKQHSRSLSGRKWHGHKCALDQAEPLRQF